MKSKHVPHRFSKEHEDQVEEIGDYMTSPVMSVDSEASVKEVAQIMLSKHIGSLLVKKGNEFAGIITENDLSHKVVADSLDPGITLRTDATASISTRDSYAGGICSRRAPTGSRASG